jgi:hypothetical protein
MNKSDDATTTHESEPAQDKKMIKSDNAKTTHESEPAQDAKMTKNNIISKAKKPEMDFSEVTEEDNKGEAADDKQVTVSLATRNDQSKTGLKPTYRDPTKKPDKNISL